MATALLHSSWQGVGPQMTPSVINRVMSHIHCTASGLTKRNHQSVGTGSGVHGLLPAETLSVDYQGTINPISVRGYNGFFLFKDLFSGYRHAIFVKDKSGSTFLSATEQVIGFYRQHGHHVRHIRCDAGSSENDLAAGTALQERHGVTMQPAAPGHHHRIQSNGRFKVSSKGSAACFMISNPWVQPGGTMRSILGSPQQTADPIEMSG